MSNNLSSKNGRGKGSKKPALQNINPNPVVQTAGKQGTGPDAEVVAASVKTLGEMATTLGIGAAESVANRRAIVPDGIVPEDLTDVAIEVATKHPDLVEKHFDLAKVKEARSSIVALQEVAGAAFGLGKEVEDEILRRRAVVGKESRTLYRVLTAIAPTPLGAPILEPLDRMTRAMRKGPPGTSKKAMAKAVKTAEAALTKGASAPEGSTPPASPPPAVTPPTTPPPTEEPK